MVALTVQDAKLASTATAARFYRPELDVLRFFAFALVFLHHLLPIYPEAYTRILPARFIEIPAALVASGGFGVALFFFLSAFLITTLLGAELEQTGSISVRAFYIRRTLRIWPLYLLCLGVGAAYMMMLSWLGHPVKPATWVMLAAFAVMLGNWFFATGHQIASNPITPLWSISVEEQFYLLWPALVKFAGRRGVGAASVFLLATAITTEWLLGQAHAERNMVIWSNTFVGFEFFSAGALLAIWLRGRAIRARWGTRLAFVLAGAVSWFVAAFYFHVEALGSAPGGLPIVAGYALVTLGATCLFLAVWGQSGWPTPLIRLGRISYGLYVFHLPAIFAASEVVDHAWHGSPLVNRTMVGSLALVLTISAAEASYRLFETPFLKLKDRFAKVLTRPV